MIQYKWYNPDRTSYKPEQIADYFVSLLEEGYMCEEDQSAFDTNKAISKLNKGKSAIVGEFKNELKKMLQPLDELEC